MINDLNLVSSFLARRDIEPLSRVKVDAIFLIGSSLIGSVRLAAEAVHARVAPIILCSGGVGHSTQDLRDQVASVPQFTNVTVDGRGEAEIFRDLLVDHFAVPGDQVYLETVSTNCGANAVESRKLADSIGGIQSGLIIQDPTMQLRTHASFDRAYMDSAIRLFSYAPFVPMVEVGTNDDFEVVGDSDPIWPFSRFLSLILGEIDRLRDDENGYGPNGKNFIDHVEIPAGVLEAAGRIKVQMSTDRGLTR